MMRELTQTEIDVAHIMSEMGNKSYISSEDVANMIISKALRRVITTEEERQYVIEKVREYRSNCGLEELVVELVKYMNSAPIASNDFTFGFAEPNHWGKL